MAASLRFALVCTLAPGIAFAQPAEQRVEFLSGGQPLVGTLAVPAGDPAPVVLLLHGFTGSRDELPIPGTDEGVFSRTARLLAESGFASLRIDFRGSGESTADLTFADTTFEGQVADALAAIDYLSKLDSVDGDDIFLIGWSQGGLVATAVAGRGAPVAAVALWQAVADPQTTFAGILGADAVARGLAAGADETLTLALPWGGEVALKGAFFDGIASFDPVAEIAGYGGPLLITRGTLDTTVPPAQADRLAAAHDGPEDVWTAPMDHVFNVFTTTETPDAMVGATVAFFKAHQG